jgi:hypothetical protein
MQTYLAAILALSLAGCVAKAAYLANDHGGYTLLSKVKRVEQAPVRFRRTADDLCEPGRYAFVGDPIKLDQGWRHGVTDLTMTVDMTCR